MQAEEGIIAQLADAVQCHERARCAAHPERFQEAWEVGAFPQLAGCAAQRFRA